jgi:3-oxoacyl-(acyl-carrier-protein) synthase
MGITSCLGNTLDDVADSLKNAKSGLRFREEFADLGIKSHVCGARPAPPRPHGGAPGPPQHLQCSLRPKPHGFSRGYV